ncbi:heparinase II/III family protein [Microbacteriaceae bacterium 4G12]
MNVDKLINNLSRCSRSYFSDKHQIPLIDDEVRKNTYLNANLLCSNIFVFKRTLDMEPCYIPYFMKEIDWNQSMNADDEWIFMLNRHEYLLDLALAYVDSKDKKYSECWKRLVCDWIKNNTFEPNKRHTSWRTIDTGIRCGSWIKSIILIYEHLSMSEIETIFSSLQEQLIYLKNQYIEKYTLSNWGILQISGILQVAMICEDLVQKEIVDWAWDELKRQCELQFHVDGIHWEQSPLYHFEVLFALLDVYQIAQYLESNIPFDLKSILEKISYAAFYMIYPNGYLVPQHDSDYISVKEIYKKIKPFHQSQMSKVFHGTDSGNLVYKTNTDFVSLWNGRHGSGHGHASLGHINLFLNGERVLCDSGRFTYQEGPLRNYLKSAESHSSIIVDEVPLTSIKDSWSYHHVGKDLANRVKETEKFVVMESTFSYSTFVVQRTVIILKEDNIVIVLDSVDSQGTHIMKRYFQLNPDIKVRKQEDSWVLKGRKNTNYAYFMGNQHTYSKKTISSNIYNQLTNRITLIEEKGFIDRGVSATIFSPEALVVMKNPIYQSGKEHPASEDEFVSFHVKSRNHDYDIYFAANDTCKGAKLYKHKNHYLYHKLTISQNGEKEIIF